MTSTEADKPRPQRIMLFARFFKGYMGVAALVTAALPIPIAAIGTIPVYSHQKAELATYTSLLCFLILAYCFYLRHSIASVLFVHRHARITLSRFIGVLPLLLILGCVASIFSYDRLLISSVHSAVRVEGLYQAGQKDQVDQAAKDTFRSGGTNPPLWVTEEGRRRLSMSFILENAEQKDIADGWLLLALYLSIFVCAECAFVLMALREYLQDVLKLSDTDVILKVTVPPTLGDAD